MKANLYAIYDELGGYLRALNLSSLEPDVFLTQLNRTYQVEPVDFVEHAVVYMLGFVDDETLEATLLPIKQLVGNTKPAFKFLEEQRLKFLEKNAKEKVAIQEAIKNA